MAIIIEARITKTNPSLTSLYQRKSQKKSNYWNRGRNKAFCMAIIIEARITKTNPSLTSLLL